MKERPIIFSGDMVRAILDNRKTMTRRVIKPQPIDMQYGPFINGKMSYYLDGWGEMYNFPRCCPYGQPGDRLWVRETHIAFEVGHVQYFADYLDHAKDKEYGVTWTPSIFMPRWASRINLEVVNVRIERVQDISEKDAKAESSSCTLWYQPFGKPEGESINLSTQAINPIHPMHGKPEGISYRNGFATLWDSINAKRGHGWDTNPWVWVVKLKRVEATK